MYSGQEATVLSRIIDIPVYYRSPDDLHDNAKWRWFYFNETVGFIWLVPRSKAIRAEYCFIQQRPSRVLVRKEFEPRGKLFQVSCRGLTNAQVFARIALAFREIQSAGFFQPFWIDRGAFDVIGPGIDWLQLASEKNV